MRFGILSALALAILALLLSMFVGGVWTALLITNLKLSPALPWSVVAMGVVLWLMWRYLDGHGPPHKTAGSRHGLLRANPVSRPVFNWALLAGLLGVFALAGFWIVLSQVVRTPGRSLPDFSQYPVVTVVAVVVMGCLVSSVAEEAAVRGYFQGYLERRLPGAAAVLISSLVLAPAHSLTQGFVWPTMLFYFAVDCMFGTMAYLTKSILPGLLIHFIGLLTFFTLVWPGDALRPPVSTAGASTWFWIHVGQTITCGILAVVTFSRLAHIQSKSLLTS